MRGLFSLLMFRDLCLVDGLKLESPRIRPPCRNFQGYTERLIGNREHSSRYFKHCGKTPMLLTSRS